VRHTDSPFWCKIAWVAVVTLCLPVAARGQACNGPTGVCELVNRFLDAFNARDFETFRSTFADDITFFVDRPFPPQRLNGRIAAEAVFKQGFAAFHPPAGGVVPPLPPPLVPIDLQVQAFGDVAVVSFVVRRPTEVARRTLVLYRGPVGWRVVHIHASSADVAKE
jgi:ketosteroid isomerase-like protein